MTMQGYEWSEPADEPSRELFPGIRLRSLWRGPGGASAQDYPAGSFIHAPAGSSHVPQSRTGCTLFVFYPEG